MYPVETGLKAALRSTAGAIKYQNSWGVDR